MSDVFDTMESLAANASGDMFDRVTAAPPRSVPSAGGDVFDQIGPAAPAPSGDVFDRVASTTPGKTAPPPPADIFDQVTSSPPPPGVLGGKLTSVPGDDSLVTLAEKAPTAALPPPGTPSLASPTPAGKTPIFTPGEAAPPETTAPEGAGMTFFREAGRSTVPAVAALAAATKTSAALSEFGLPVALVGGLAAAILTGVATSKAQDMGLEKLLGPDDMDSLNKQMEANRAAHPLVSLGGELAPQAIAGGVNPRMLADAGNAAQKLLAGGRLADGEALALINTGLGSGTAAGVEAYNQYRQGQFEPLRLIASTIAGAALNDGRLFHSPSGDFVLAEDASRLAPVEPTEGAARPAGDVFDQVAEPNKGMGQIGPRGPIEAGSAGDVFDQVAPQGTRAMSPIEGAPAAAGADINAEGAEAGQRGAVTLPRADADAMGRIRARVSQWLSPNQGVPPEVKSAWEQMQNDVQASLLTGRADRARIQGLISDMEKSGSTDVRPAVSQVMDGSLPMADFLQRYQLDPADPAVKTLADMQAMNVDRQNQIAQWPGLSEEMRQRVLDNVSYQTRFYERFVLGDAFTPRQQDYAGALTEVENGLNDAISRFADRATDVRGTRNPFDVLGYLDTGDRGMLEGLAPTRAVAADALLSQYSDLKDLVHGMALDGDTVTANANADAVSKAAQGIVDYHLLKKDSAAGGPAGGVSPANIQQRFLEGAFRQLYGEVTDPAFRQQKTAEVQGRMLATMSFINRVLSEGENTVWARRPDPARGFTEQLGNDAVPGDRKRYGDLAGRFVTPELKQMMFGTKATGPAADILERIWFTPMAVERMAMIMGPRTIARDYRAGIYGYSLGSGDLFLPSWAKHFASAHKLLTDYVRGMPSAIDKMSDLARAGVFRTDNTSSANDLQSILGGLSDKARAMGRKVIGARAFVNFPHQYAAYMARMDYGMTSAEAAQHVRDLYQNRDRVPNVIHTLTRTGFADYLGFTYDSARIRVNQMKNAVVSLSHGDPRPLAGFAMSAALSVVLANKVRQTLTRWWAQAQQGLKGRRDKSAEVATDQQTGALREFLPSYDKNAIVGHWYETDPRTGKRTLFYTAFTGQTSWPLEDAAIGALMTKEQGGDFLPALATNFGNMLKVGMYPDALKRLMTGSGFEDDNPERRGLVDVAFGKPDPERQKIVMDSLVRFASDMTIAAVSKPFQRYYDIVQRQQAGQESNVGPYAYTMTKQEALATAYRMARTYRVEKTDMNRMVRNEVQNWVGGRKKAEGIVAAEQNARLFAGASTPDQRTQAAAAQQFLANSAGKLQGIVRNAASVGGEWYRPAELYEILKDAGVDATQAAFIVGGHADHIPAFTPRPGMSLLGQKYFIDQRRDRGP